MSSARFRPLAVMFAVAALFALVGATPADAISYTWVGGAGNWNSAMYWSPSGVPGPGDDVTINGGGVVLDIDTEVQSLTLTATGSLETNLDRDLRVTGDVTLTGTGTFSSSAQKITLVMLAVPSNAILVCTLPAGIAGNLRIDGANPVALGSDLSVGGNLEVVSGALDVTAANFNLWVGGDFMVAGGTFIPNQNTVTFVGLSSNLVMDQPAPHFWNLVVPAGCSATVQGLASDLSVGGSCTLDGALNTNDFVLWVGSDVTGGGALNAGGGESITVNGDFTVASFACASSRVILAGGGHVGGFTFYDLTIDASGSIVSDGSMTVINSLAMTRGSWGPGSFEHFVGGNWNASGANFTFVMGTSTIHLTSPNPSIATKGGTQPFYNLTLDGGGNLATDVTVNVDLVFANATPGTLNLGGHNLRAGRNLRRVFDPAELVAGGSQDITVGATWDVGSFVAGSSRVLCNSTYGTNLNSACTFYDLQIDKASPGSTVSSNAGGLTVTHSLVMAQGTWNANGLPHTVAGDWDSSVASFSFVPGGSILTLTDPNPTIATKGAAQPLGGLVLSGGGTLASDLVVGGDLVIGQNAAGTLNLGGNDLRVGRTLTHSFPSSGLVAGGSSNITVGESWDVGNFDASTSTVIFDSAGYTSSIYGDNDFYTFRCVTPDKILRLDPGKTQRILNVLDLAGAAGQNIQLLSEATPASWIIDNAGGAESVSYVTVQDSSVAGINDIHAYNSTYISNVDQLSPGWVFASPDVTPPTVDTVDPANGTVDVPVGTDLQVTFSEAMLGSTLNPATLLLEAPGPVAVAGSVSYVGASQTAFFVPDATLSYETLYTATVTTGAQDASGNPLAAAYAWSFTTEAAPPGLLVSAGPSPPPSVKVSPDAAAVPVLQLHLSASPDDVELISLTLHGSGSGDEARDIAGVRLYVDGDSNGLVGPADTELSRAGFSEDDGTVSFDGLSHLILGGSSVDLLVAYDFDAATLAGAPPLLPGPAGRLRPILPRPPVRPLLPLGLAALASIFLLALRLRPGRSALGRLVRAGLLAAVLVASSCVLRPLLDTTYTLQAAGPADVQAVAYPAGPPAAVTLAGPIQGAEVNIDRIGGGP